MKAKHLIALLLGGLILTYIGHNIVPHHHHLDDFYSHSGCEQHDIKDQNQDAEHHTDAEHHETHSHKTGDPVHHCHAFNDFEYLISFENQINKETFTKISCSYSNTLIIENEPLPRKKNTCWSSGIPPDFQGFLGGSPGLRAPPVIS